MISREDFEGWVEFMDETISQFLYDLSFGPLCHCGQRPEEQFDAFR
jgi:hypothetical protein